MKHVVFTVGRFNPPTIGHLKLFDAVQQLSQSLACDYKLFTTETVDDKRNPLSLIEKMEYLRELMPQHTVESTINPFHACRQLAAMGYDTATIVVGSDRDLGIVAQLNAYVAHPDKAHDIGLTHVEGYVIVRDEIFSASNARDAAKNGNFEEFQKQIPNADSVIITNMYSAVRRNLKVS